MLANGSGKSRSTKDLRLRKPIRWRLLFLSSGEISLADKIGEDGKGRKETAGQKVRLIEVTADTGVFGLFEDLHGATDAAEFANQLMAAARKHYGTPARSFIQAIAGDLEAVKGNVKAGCKTSSMFFVPVRRMAKSSVYARALVLPGPLAN